MSIEDITHIARSLEALLARGEIKTARCVSLRRPKSKRVLGSSIYGIIILIGHACRLDRCRSSSAWLGATDGSEVRLPTLSMGLRIS